jgi:hypothetical protein
MMGRVENYFSVTIDDGNCDPGAVTIGASAISPYAKNVLVI